MKIMYRVTQGLFFLSASLLFISLAILISMCNNGCSFIDSLSNSDVCIDDQQLGPSRLCDICMMLEEKTGKHVKLESVGYIMKVTNSVMIGQGAYSADDALREIERIEGQINKGITYSLLGEELEDLGDQYPGLFEVADLFIENAVFDEILTSRDEGYILYHLDDQKQMLLKFKARNEG